jgi:xanthine dehydrogenase accessory factor
LSLVSERSAATHDLDAVLEQALAWRAAGRKVALATVTQTWGSSPRPAGSKLAVNDASEFVGSVSGGCIEGAVIQEGLEVMAGAPAHAIDFGVSDETAWEVGLACGGKVSVFVEPLDGELPGVLEALLAARRAHTQAVLVTALTGAPRHVLATGAAADARAGAASPGATAAGIASTGAANLADPGLIDGSPALAAAIAAAVVTDRAQVTGGWLVEPHLAPLRLIVVGAVHVAQPLAEMAGRAGFAVTIVDPRRAFATAARFPGQPLVVAWPDVAIRELAPDARTAIVTLTHDPKLDDPGLVAALASPAFYVGCLGSGKTHAARRIRLVEQGVAEAALARLHGPVGLTIGARTPAEIAVSILAEIIATLRQEPRA